MWKFPGGASIRERVQPGDLFFALRGPTHDGNAYVGQVFQKGAVAAVADRDVAEPGVVFRVEDSLRALQTIAGAARRSFPAHVVAVTGSAGKTTTKDMIAEMLSVGMKTAKNEGNLNNHVGLPLSLLRLPEDAAVAVLEIGMNHAGEIRDLAAIAQPDVGVVTNVGYAHIEVFRFGRRHRSGQAGTDRVVAAGRDGRVECRRSSRFEISVCRRGRILYGQSAEAEVRAEDVEYSLDGTRFRVGETQFSTALTGRHSVSNILAGIAVAGIYGIEPARLTAFRCGSLCPEKCAASAFASILTGSSGL